MKFTQTNVVKLAPPAGKNDVTIWDDELPGFGIRFQNGGIGTYLIQYYLNGKPRKLGLGKVTKVNLDAARIEARKAFGLIAQKIDPAKEREKRVALATETVGQLIPLFLAWLETVKKRAPSYVAENRRSLERYFKSLHKYGVAEVTRSLVSDALDEITEERGPIAARNSRAHLQKFFNWCIATGKGGDDLRGNPVAGTNKEKANQRDRVLDDAEIKAIWHGLPREGDYGDIMRLLILTAQRRTEIAALEWSEVDFAKEQITLAGGVDVRRTKNKKEHIVPLGPSALAILKRRHETRDDKRSHVFGEGEGPFSGFSNAREALDKRMQEDKTTVQTWVPHDFRRTFNTVSGQKLGMPPHIGEAVLNHISSVESGKKGVAGIYNRADYVEGKRKALKVWDSYIKRVVGPKPVPNQSAA